VGDMVVLRLLWSGVRRDIPLSSQVVVARLKQSPKAHLAAGLIAAIALFAVPKSPACAQVTDVRTTTGRELAGRLDQLREKPNVRAALRYFEDQKLRPFVDGLAELKARRATTDENLTLTFIPVTGETPSPGLDHVVISAEDSKGGNVLLGTISSETKEPQVKDEKILIDGKVQPGKGFMQAWLKCSLTGCAQALACFATGPAWATCLCISCGIAVGSCGVIEYFFP
jgi:hypothetical protein